jgi:hypothetical protein
LGGWCSRGGRGREATEIKVIALGRRSSHGLGCRGKLKVIVVLLQSERQKDRNDLKSGKHQSNSAPTNKNKQKTNTSNTNESSMNE